MRVHSETSEIVVGEPNPADRNLQSIVNMARQLHPAGSAALMIPEAGAWRLCAGSVDGVDLSDIQDVLDRSGDTLAMLNVAGRSVHIAPIDTDGAGPAALLVLVVEGDLALGGAQRVMLADIAGLAAVVLRHGRDAALLAKIKQDYEAQSNLVREQERALAHSKKVFERSSAVAKIGVWECDLATQALRWTDGVYDIFELPRGLPVRREQIVALYEPESLQELERVRAQAIEKRDGFTLDTRIITARGQSRWMRITANIECEDGVPVRIFGMKQDITEEKALWERTRFLAEFDVMTGLANRSLFQAKLAELCNIPEGDPPAFVLALIDLDGFKQVNDTFGHAVGDECLKQIASRLRTICNHAQIVARLGGDEFAVILGPDFDPALVDLFADRVLRELRRPIEWFDQSFQLGASIGIAIPDASDCARPSDLFSKADIALYAAKLGGRNTVRTFVPAMKSQADLRFEIVRSINGALTDGNLDLHYQPKFSLQDRSLSGFEALLRWRKPDGEIVAASNFEPAFEDPQLSRRIGEWVLRQALRQAREWKRAGLDFGHIAINLGSSQLGGHLFAEKLMEQIAAHGLPPRMIEVEVTEGIFLDGESGAAKRTLALLKAHGVRVSLDDFGTGHASLVHLRTCPIDTIKIDRSFVQRFVTSLQDRAIMEAVVRLGLSLGLDVVAEGIETIGQFEKLRALGCTHGQGFLFSKAVPAAEALQWLAPEGFGRARVA